MMRVWLFRFALALSCPSIPVWACDCRSQGTSCAYIDRAAVVFIGTVAFNDHDPALGTQQRTLVKFKVEEAFKGIAPGVQEIWVDPGSFTSCYAEYTAGERLLVFAYDGFGLPSDTSAITLIPGEPKQKPLP